MAPASTHGLGKGLSEIMGRLDIREPKPQLPVEHKHKDTVVSEQQARERHCTGDCASRKFPTSKENPAGVDESTAEQKTKKLPSPPMSTPKKVRFALPPKPVKVPSYCSKKSRPQSARVTNIPEQYWCHIPATFLIYQDLGEDDVFLALNFPWTAADFDQRPMRDLVRSCFLRIENVVHELSVQQIHGHSNLLQVQELFTRAVRVLGCQRAAIQTISSTAERSHVMVAVLNTLFTDHIFDQSILEFFDSAFTNNFMYAWNEEQAVFHDPLEVENLRRRSDLAHRRARTARIVTTLPGFWEGALAHAKDLTRYFISLVTPAFPTTNPDGLSSNMLKAVTEMLRVAIRMRTEPTFHETYFFKRGTGFSYHSMIHRNPELQDQVIPSVCCPYVVRTTLSPCVKLKTFDDWMNDNVPTEIVHMANVVVADRNSSLRSNERGRRARYFPSPR